jgi:predicted dehydrogenase
MGQQMLGRMAKFPGFDVVAAWDPSIRAMQETAERYPNVRLADNLHDAVGMAGVAVVYIAAPPFAHRRAAEAAFDAERAVYCEKPLGVDLGQSRELVERAERSGAVNIVNFSLATTAATAAMETWLAQGRAGTVVGIEIRVRFSQWPRHWQMSATEWLSRRAEGGMTREVLSHWIYLTERLFGPTAIDEAWVGYPGDDLAEISVSARMSVEGIPLSVSGMVGGVGPDTVEYTVWGSEASGRINDWRHFLVTTGETWSPPAGGHPPTSDEDNANQLANAAAAVAGEPHTMPTFADALAVQTQIERILAA